MQLASLSQQRRRCRSAPRPEMPDGHDHGHRAACETGAPSEFGALRMDQLTTNQASLALAVTALLRWMVNELAATSGTAERTQTPLRSCCKVASTRLAAVSATPAWVADDLPAATVRMPLRLNTAGPAAFSAVPPAVFSASTPIPPAAVATPCTPLPEEAVPATPSPAGEPKPATRPPGAAGAAELPRGHLRGELSAVGRPVTVRQRLVHRRPAA